jgi:hypothetical protein
MRALIITIILLPVLVSAQLGVVLDSIKSDRLYKYPLGDYTLSPHYQDLHEYPDSLLRTVAVESVVQRLYIDDVLLSRAYDHDMQLAWPDAWRKWLATYIRPQMSLVKYDVVLESDALASAAAATLLQDHDLEGILDRVTHPQIRAYIGRALIRRKDYDQLDRLLPQWIGDTAVLLQQEGCNHYDRLVGDYILRGAGQPGAYQRVLDRYEALLLRVDNRLDATASLLMRSSMPDSLMAVCSLYLHADRLPVAAATGIILRRDSLSAPAFTRVVDLVICDQLDPRQIARIPALFRIGGADLRSVVDQQDVLRLDEYIIENQEKVRLSIGWPFYRWLYLDPAYTGLVRRATRRRIIPAEQLSVKPTTTYNIKFK